MATPALADFPARTFEKLRYADTDRQGHVNNAIFATMLETGRVELLYAPDAPIFEAGCAFVIASLHLDFLGEVTWPGQVDIGTRVAAIGKSSVTLEQVSRLGLETGPRIAAPRVCRRRLHRDGRRPRRRRRTALGPEAGRCSTERSRSPRWALEAVHFLASTVPLTATAERPLTRTPGALPSTDASRWRSRAKP